MSTDEPVDVMLFMPEATFGEIHGHATRLGVTDAALFTACWLSARPRIEANPPERGSARLLAGPSGAVYFSLASAVHNDALAFAETHDRSMSWAFLRAWDLVRTQVATLSTPEQLARWQIRSNPLIQHDN